MTSTEDTRPPDKTHSAPEALVGHVLNGSPPWAKGTMGRIRLGREEARDLHRILFGIEKAALLEYVQAREAGHRGAHRLRVRTRRIEVLRRKIEALIDEMGWADR